MDSAVKQFRGENDSYFINPQRGLCCFAPAALDRYLHFVVTIRQQMAATTKKTGGVYILCKSSSLLIPNDHTLWRCMVASCFEELQGSNVIRGKWEEQLLMSCKSPSSTDGAAWNPGNRGTPENSKPLIVFLLFVALHCNMTSELTEGWAPKREHEYSTSEDTNGDEVCDYISSDNCDCKIRHTTPEGIFIFHPGAWRQMSLT